MSEEITPTIGAMRGTARLVIPREQPKPALRLVRDEEQEEQRPEERVEKEDEHGR